MNALEFVDTLRFLKKQLEMLHNVNGGYCHAEPVYESEELLVVEFKFGTCDDTGRIGPYYSYCHYSKIKILKMCNQKAYSFAKYILLTPNNESKAIALLNKNNIKSEVEYYRMSLSAIYIIRFNKIICYFNYLATNSHFWRANLGSSQQNQTADLNQSVVCDDIPF